MKKNTKKLRRLQTTFFLCIFNILKTGHQQKLMLAKFFEDRHLRKFVPAKWKNFAKPLLPKASSFKVIITLFPVSLCITKAIDLCDYEQTFLNGKSQNSIPSKKVHAQSQQ